MARSRHISNYETTYWDILAAMQDNIPELTFTLDRKTANNIQQTFYSFIRAMEHTANIKAIGNDAIHATQLRDNANTMRGYIATVTHENATQSTLRFINRDLNAATQDFRDQLAKQLNTRPALAVESKDITIQSVSSFFDTELKIEDNNDHEQQK